MERRARLLAIALVLLVVMAGVGLALTNGVFVTGTVPIDAENGPQVDVTVSSESELDLTDPFPDSNTVNVTHADGTVVFSSNGQTVAEVQSSEITGTYTVVTGIDASNELTIDPEDKRAITVGGGIDSVEFRDASVDNGNVDFRYSASSSASVTMGELPADSTLLAVDAGTGAVLDQTTSDSSGSATFGALDSGSHDVLINEASDPVVDNGSASPSGGETVSETPVELSINVSDPDFGTAHGDELTVIFYDANDDSEIGTANLTSNGTATVTHEGVLGGENKWYVEVNDSYGASATSDADSSTAENEPFSFQGPDMLEVYNEAEPNKLIKDNATLRTRFFVDNEEQVIERNVTSGTVSLEGLPIDQQIIVTVRDDDQNYTYRRIIIDSITETAEIYLLPVEEPSSRITFRLDDSTGRFPSEETQLYVERPITRNNTTEYRTIAGDVFGGSGEFPVDLITDERYRLRVVNAEGEERVLGSYTVAGDDIAVLPIGRVVLEGNQDLNGTVSASIKESDGDNYDHVAKVVYLDQEELTDSLTITILDENGTKIRPETTETGPFGRYIETYPLENYTEGDSYTVRVEVDRDGKTFTIERSIGELPDITGGWEIDRRVLELIGYVALVSVMGLVVIVSPPLGAAAGVITAFILTIIGVTPIPMVGVAVAGCISILFMAGGD